MLQVSVSSFTWHASTHWASLMCRTPWGHRDDKIESSWGKRWSNYISFHCHSNSDYDLEAEDNTRGFHGSEVQAQGLSWAVCLGSHKTNIEVSAAGFLPRRSGRIHLQPHSGLGGIQFLMVAFLCWGWARGHIFSQCQGLHSLSSLPCGPCCLKQQFIKSFSGFQSLWLPLLLHPFWIFHAF